MDTPQLSVEQEHWARQSLGFIMRHQMSGEIGIAMDWEPGKNGRGVWFLTHNGLRIYRQFPKRLLEGNKSTP